MANRPRKWEAAFLEALEDAGTMAAAVRAVQIGRQTVYDDLNVDPQLLDRCRDAVESVDHELGAEARRRAVEGEQVPGFYRGKMVGHKPGKSDSLMMYFLKNHGQRREPVIRQLFA